MRRALIVLAVIFLLVSCSEHKTRLMVGGFAKQGEKGLFIFDFSMKTGKLTPVSGYDVGPNPSYFCYSGREKLLYVANEVTTYNGQPGGGLTTYRFNDDGSLEKAGEMTVPYGGTCYISLSSDSSSLFLANYPKGSVEVVKLDEKGIPAVITDTILYEADSAKVSHAHMIINDPRGVHAYVSDLGLDRLMIYAYQPSAGLLSPVDTVPVEEGSGPRHFTFSSDGSILYLINELGSKMMVFRLSKDKKPELLQALPSCREGFTGKNACADVHLGKDGKFLYGSNRGENSIVVYAVQPDGTLKLAGHTSCGGNWPRSFVIDPSGNFLLAGNQKSDTVSVFRINSKSGLPGEPPVKYYVPAPACLKFY